MHDVIAHLPRWHMAGVTYDCRRPERTLHPREVRAIPWPTTTSPGFHLFRAIVARENNDGFVGDAEFLEIVEEFSEIAVELQQRIGEVAVARLALELDARDRRQVHH